MLNIEKYLEELKKYKCEFTVNKENKFTNCFETNCSNCKFKENNNKARSCVDNRMFWLFKEEETHNAEPNEEVEE